MHFLFFSYGWFPNCDNFSISTASPLSLLGHLFLRSNIQNYTCPQHVHLLKCVHLTLCDWLLNKNCCYYASEDLPNEEIKSNLSISIHRFSHCCCWFIVYFFKKSYCPTGIKHYPLCLHRRQFQSEWNTWNKAAVAATSFPNCNTLRLVSSQVTDRLPGSIAPPLQSHLHHGTTLSVILHLLFRHWSSDTHVCEQMSFSDDYFLLEQRIFSTVTVKFWGFFLFFFTTEPQHAASLRWFLSTASDIAIRANT